MADELLTVEEVAAQLKLHTDTIRRYIREKKLQAIRLSNNTLRVRQSEVDRLLREHETDKDA